MNASKVVIGYEEHVSKKLHEIAMSATMAEANILKAVKAGVTEEAAKQLESALVDIRAIHSEYTSNDFSSAEFLKTQILGGNKQ